MNAFSVADRYSKIQTRIQTAWNAAPLARRAPKLPTLIAVSKSQPLERIRELYALGHRDFGENYVDEILEKHHALTLQGITDVRWHFIGHLQSNKAKRLLEKLGPQLLAIHSVDSLKLAREISKHANKLSLCPAIYLQINLDGEETKHGWSPGEITPHLIAEIRDLPAMALLGLMTIPRVDSDRGAFSRLAALTPALAQIGTAPQFISRLSMGMSGDFEVAINEGATDVRVGSALFGERV